MDSIVLETDSHAESASYGLENLPDTKPLGDHY